MTSVEMVVAIATSSAFTGAVVEVVREIRKIADKKRNKGLAKLQNDIDDMRSQSAVTCGEIKTIHAELLARQETDKVILHDRIWEVFHTLADEETIEVEDMANLDYLYEEYVKLCGNHQAETMYNFVKNKPVRMESKHNGKTQK